MAAARRRYCDTETGEELGWLVSPFLEGLHHGYRATGDAVWIERLIDWGEAWTGRAVTEPDGYPGWPKAAGASTPAVPDLYTDNLLGEAMALRPMVESAAAILTDAELAARFGAQARRWVVLGERVFEKWDARGCWRDVAEGGVWVAPHFGIDRASGGWTDGYARRGVEGFTLPANKQNHVARWLLAMHAATGRPVYRARAEAWWRVMKGRMRLRADGRGLRWNYWDPAGPWDRRPDGSPRHWVGVHPNGGYYAIDVQGMAAAYGEGLVFGDDDLRLLVATNRDCMWDGVVPGARFRRIDDGPADPRWKDRPGCLWEALVPFDATLRRIFEADHRPAGWGGLAGTPWYLALLKEEGGSG